MKAWRAAVGLLGLLSCEAPQKQAPPIVATHSLRPAMSERAALTRPADLHLSCEAGYETLLLAQAPAVTEPLRQLSRAAVITSYHAPLPSEQLSKRQELDALLAEFTREDLTFPKQQQMRALYDTLGASEQHALARHYHLPEPSITVMTSAHAFYRYTARLSADSTLADSLETARSVREGSYAGFVDVGGAPVLSGYFGLTMLINPFAKVNPRRLALHERVHVLQFALYFGGLRASCASTPESCMISWEGQADYFESWLYHSTDFDKTTQDSLAPYLLSLSVDLFPTQVDSLLSERDFSIYNRYSRGQALFAALVQKYGLDSASYLFTTRPPCPSIAMPGTSHTGHAR